MTFFRSKHFPMYTRAKCFVTWVLLCICITWQPSSTSGFRESLSKVAENWFTLFLIKFVSWFSVAVNWIAWSILLDSRRFGNISSCSVEDDAIIQFRPDVHSKIEWTLSLWISLRKSAVIRQHQGIMGRLTVQGGEGSLPFKWMQNWRVIRMESAGAENRSVILCSLG